MSFFGTLAVELGKVALTGISASQQAQAQRAQARHDKKYGVTPPATGEKKQGAATTCTPCAARARVEAAKGWRK